MNAARFHDLTSVYPRLRLAVVGDFCLDRYFDIDPARAEVSIETGLEVHNIVGVRCQPGGAGTILNNLVALGVGTLYPVGFCGADGEGFELQRSLRSRAGVRLDHFLETSERRTFTYTKPLVHEPGHPPRELSRLDIKNWSPTPASVQEALRRSVRALADQVDAWIILDQVDVAETGVVTQSLLAELKFLAVQQPQCWILADSRRGLRGWPQVCCKMNAAELRSMTGASSDSSLEAVQETAAALARQQGRAVFVTLSERGMVAADPQGSVAHAPALPVRGPIDIVGAGDSVTANLTAALASGASLAEASQLAMAASSIVIHQLGTTGTASVDQIRDRLFAAG